MQDGQFSVQRVFVPRSSFYPCALNDLDTLCLRGALREILAYHSNFCCVYDDIYPDLCADFHDIDSHLISILDQLDKVVFQ